MAQQFFYVGYGRFIRVAEYIQDDRTIAGISKLYHHVRPNIPSSTGNQYVLHISSVYQR